ncbi:protein SET DOMAIN GROUP [Salix suchowensis]|nr:protein SET DOMAIN GROUP [Salix suchowensis]
MEDAEQEGFERFLKWAANLGISDCPTNRSLQTKNPTSCLGHSLTVSHFPDAGGRGLAAVRDIKKGELKLTVCLLYEMGKGKSSWWYPYLMHLPRSYDVLASFSEFEMQALQVDDAIWSAEKAVSKAKSEWKEAYSLMDALKLKPQLLMFRAWIWASATISSRALHIPWDEAGCLCPVGDLFNYAAPGEESNDLENVVHLTNASSLEDTSLSNGENTDDSIRDQPGIGLELLTLTNASSLEDTSLLNGETTDDSTGDQPDIGSERLTDGGFDETWLHIAFMPGKITRREIRYYELLASWITSINVLLGYGTYTNLELLEHYGFLLNENPNDKVFIPLEPSMYSFISWPKVSMYIHQDGKPSFALLSTLRIWATPPNQRRSISHLAYSGSQLSVDNEISTFPVIDHRQNKKFAQPYGAQEAAVRIRGSELMFSGKTKRVIDRWGLAVQWRIRYKKILIDCISYCTLTINSLSSQNILAMRA